MSRNINTYMLFADLTSFITSDFYRNNISSIMIYPPVKDVFNAVPPYKPYRIVVRSMGDSYHTVYTIDANKSNFNDVCGQLEDLGAVNQITWGKEKSAAANANDISQAKSTADTLRNYQIAHPPPSDDGMSGWDAFKEGFGAVVDVAKTIIPLVV